LLEIGRIFADLWFPSSDLKIGVLSLAFVWCRYCDRFGVGSRTDNRNTFATKTIRGFRPSGQPIGYSNSLQTNLCVASATAPALPYLLHPCSRKESIQRQICRE